MLIQSRRFQRSARGLYLPEGIKLIGRVRGILLDPITGEREEAESPNMFLTAGHIALLKSIQWGHADAGKAIRYVGIGSGVTAPTAGDLSLGTEIIRSELQPFTNTDIDDTTTPQWVANKTWAPGDATGDITEVGLFIISAGGNPWFRALFGQATITNATKTNPVVITAAGHGRTDGDQVKITSVGGMTQLNGNKYYVKNTSPAGNDLELYSDEALTTSVNGTAYSDYTTGGKVSRVFTWTVAKSFAVQYTVSCPV